MIDIFKMRKILHICIKIVKIITHLNVYFISTHIQNCDMCPAYSSTVQSLETQHWLGMYYVVKVTSWLYLQVTNTDLSRYKLSKCKLMI